RHNLHVGRKTANLFSEDALFTGFGLPKIYFALAGVSGMALDEPLQPGVGACRTSGLHEPFLVVAEQIPPAAKGRVPGDVREDDCQLFRVIESQRLTRAAGIDQPPVELGGTLSV